MCGCQCSSSPWVWIATTMPGRHVLAAEQAADLVPHARPGAAAELAQQLAVEAGVQPQSAWGWSAPLAGAQQKTDFLGHVPSGQQRPLLVATRAGQRCLQEKATKNSWRQSGQRTRAKPSARSPQRRNAATARRRPVARSRTWPRTAAGRPAERSRSAAPSAARAGRPADYAAVEGPRFETQAETMG